MAGGDPCMVMGGRAGLGLLNGQELGRRRWRSLYGDVRFPDQHPPMNRQND